MTLVGTIHRVLSCTRTCTYTKLTPWHTHTRTHHAGVLVATLAVAERAGQRARARLVVAGRLTVVRRRVDRDRPHARRVAVTVAVVIGPAVARRPHVDRPQPVPTLQLI